MTEDCLFCRIIAGEISAQIVLQTPTFTAFYDINPQAPVHVLLISPTHTATHLQTDDPALFGHLMAGAQQVAQHLGLTNYRLVMNNGAGAGQSVFHMHLHLLAGRPLSWPPG